MEPIYYEQNDFGGINNGKLENQVKEDGNTSTGSAIKDIKEKTNPLTEDFYLNFGKNLTEKEKDMIDSWDKDFREKMKGVLTFEEETTIIKINGTKLFFPKNPVYLRDNKDIESKLANKSLRLLNPDEIKLIKEMFSSNIKEFKNIINLPKDEKYYSEITYHLSSYSEENKLYSLIDEKYYFISVEL